MTSYRAAAATVYERLAVHPSASTEELRAAYRAALRRSHPDSGGTAAAFQQVQAAWALVATPEQRRGYDAQLAQAHAGAAGSGSGRFGTPGNRAGGAGVHANKPGSVGDRRNPQRIGEPGASHVRHAHTLREQAADAHTRQLPEETQHLLAQARRSLARAQQTQRSASVLDTLGIGVHVWHDRAAIDHIVLAPSGLYAIDSADWGEPVRLLRDQIVGEGVAEGEHPVSRLQRNARALGRKLGLEWTAHLVVVPDDCLPDWPAQRSYKARPPVVLLRESVLPYALNMGIDALFSDEPPARSRTSLSNAYEYRARLKAALTDASELTPATDAGAGADNEHGRRPQ